MGDRQPSCVLSVDVPERSGAHGLQQVASAYPPQASLIPGRANFHLLRNGNLQGLVRCHVDGAAAAVAIVVAAGHKHRHRPRADRRGRCGRRVGRADVSAAFVTAAACA